MALNAKKIKGSGKSNFKRPPPLEAGTYPARLVQVVDLGLQPQRPWQGEEKPPKPEVHFTYELLDEFLLDEEGNDLEDKPRWQSETLPMNSLDSDLAKSTQRYYALDPSEEKGGDWVELLGTPCMVTITAQKDKKGKEDDDGNTIIYNNIASVQTMRDKDAKKASPLVNEAKAFDMEDPDMEVYFSLPDWIRNKIKESLEFSGTALADSLEGVNEEESVKAYRESKSEGNTKTEKKETKAEDNNDEEDW